MRRSAHQHGFTLVELLVVIAIIGVLVALLLPAIQAAREAARRSQCQSQLKQIGVAVLNYESGKKRFPAGSTSLHPTDKYAGYKSTWSVDILPYMEQQPLFAQWHPKDNSTPPKDIDFSHALNKSLRETFLPSYLCPSDVEREQLVQAETGVNVGVYWAPGSYRAMSGYSPGKPGAGDKGDDNYWDNVSNLELKYEEWLPMWTRGPLHVVAPDAAGNRNVKPVRSKDIADGASNTLLVGEYHTTTHMSRRTMWAYAYTSYNQSSAMPESRTLLPDFDACDRTPGGVNTNCLRGWGSLHAGNIIQYVKCDGSVTSISQDIDISIFGDMATIAQEGAKLN